jgi:hypothetical protein
MSIFNKKYATFEQINILKKVKILFTIEFFLGINLTILCFWTNFDKTKRVQNTEKGNKYFPFLKKLLIFIFKFKKKTPFHKLF